MHESNRKIAVLTSGGDAPGMNAAVRAVARTAWSHYFIDALEAVLGDRELTTTETAPERCTIKWK